MEEDHKDDEHKEHHKKSASSHNEIKGHEVHKNHKKPLSKSFYLRLYVILGLTMIFIALYNVTQTSSFANTYEEKVAEAKEEARPAELQLITITDSRCTNCYDITTIVDNLKKSNVDITKEENVNIESDQAKELINKYNIQKIPTILLLGEIDRFKSNDLDKVDDALVFTKVTPPYTDAVTSKIKGQVSVTIIEDKDCQECSDLNNLLDIIKKSGVQIVFEKTLDKSQATELINKYSIEILPTLILSEEFGDYKSEIVNEWKSVGTVESDNSYITRNAGVPYLNLTSDRIEGFVSMKIIVDESCDTCYDPNDFHKPVLKNMGVMFAQEKIIDLSDTEGKTLIDVYNIEKIPTIILEGDVNKYPALVNAWQGVGTIESDGAYVFRLVEVAKQPYRDLITNKIIDPTIQDE